MGNTKKPATRDDLLAAVGHLRDAAGKLELAAGLLETCDDTAMLEDIEALIDQARAEVTALRN